VASFRIRVDIRRGYEFCELAHRGRPAPTRNLPDPLRGEHRKTMMTTGMWMVQRKQLLGPPASAMRLKPFPVVRRAPGPAPEEWAGRLAY